MRIVRRMALLVALWLLAWGELSVANVVSGIAVAGALLVAFPLRPRSGPPWRVRPLGVVRLAGYVVYQLVSSNFVMTRQIVRRHPNPNEGVLAHRLAEPSPEAVTVMTSVIALSPGTMVVDVDPASSVIYVHFLFLDDVGRAHAELARLERLVVGALLRRSLPSSVGPVPPKESP
jgi:multicomponent Na+:H+ antiporter subunit E